MIVVSDTTAITTLLKAGMEGLLPELFENVTIPQADWDEWPPFTCNGRIPFCSAGWDGRIGGCRKRHCSGVAKPKRSRWRRRLLPGRARLF